MSPAIDPFDPAILAELRRRLAAIDRRHRASPQQFAERLLQIALEMRSHPRPQVEMFYIMAANALAGAVLCLQRDAEREDRHGKDAGALSGLS